jgi:site-specific DNA-adenine methylase
MPTIGRQTTPPPLKWAGGKRWQVPHLRPLWQPHARRRLVEPFCGGLAVTLGLAPQYAKGGFTWADQERTAAWLTKHPGPVVLVNQATPRIEALYRKLGYRVQFLEAPRRSRHAARSVSAAGARYRAGILEPLRTALTTS